MRAEDNLQMTTLSPASYGIVMTAIKHAKIKGHCQVQPLHVAAALLDPQTRTIALHNACLQSLKDPTHTLKCDALDLCFKVALDRLPVITDPEKCKDQAMSNALGAALKRAHANERRGTPEQSLQPLLAVKTGIAHLTISILDDPSVSRVFREAGFSSTAVKNNMEEAVAKAALAGNVHPPLDTSGMRRMPFPMTPFSNTRLDGVQFRNSYFTGPFSAAGDPSNNHGKLLDRATMGSNGMDVLAERESSFLGSCLTRQDAPHPVARSFGPTAPKFLVQSPLQQQKRHEPAWMLGRYQDNASLRAPAPPPTARHEADIASIVQTIMYPKRRNPVLVSDGGSNLVVKEFSQRLSRGEVTQLAGVSIVDLPFTSLSVGILSQDAFEQKLAKLKRDVEGCVQTGGAIISVGDLQWLLEPCNNLASLVLQELQQLNSSNAYNRLWLLASAAPKTLERCIANKRSVMDSLALHPVMLVPDSPGPAFQARQGSHYSTKNAEVSFSGQPGSGATLAAAKPVLVQNGLEKSDCCPDCDSKFQQECSVLIKAEQTLHLGSGPSPAYPKLPWMQNEKEKNRSPLPVKEEENVISHRIEELRQKWQRQCSTQHSQRFTSSLGSGVTRDQSTSPVPEIVSPQPSEMNSRLSLPMLSTAVPSKWVPQQPVKISSDEKSMELGPLLARIARGGSNNLSNFLSMSKPGIRPPNREAENKSGEEAGRLSLSWMRRDSGGFAGPTTLSMEPPANNANNNNPKSGKALPQSSALMRSSDAENLNGLCWTLSNAVAWQKEAVGAVAATVMKCRRGEGRKTVFHARTDAWLMFLGPDRVGKREVAKALAKLVFNREDNLILLTGWRSDSSGRSQPSTGILAADSNGVPFRGKSPLDRLAEALLRKPFSVVLLEDVERADPVFKRSLTKAMGRGRLADSSGREVSLANVIIIMTCSAGASFLTSQERNPQSETAMEFDEEKLSVLGPHEVRISTESTASVNVLQTKGQGLSIVDSVKTEHHEQEALKEEGKPAESILLFGSPMFKRKAADSILSDENLRGGSRSPPAKLCKREEDSPNRAFSLDLNLSVEENLSEDEEPCITEEPCEMSEVPKSLEELTSKVIDSARGQCPAEMFAMLDAAVVFKPFNLNGLTDWVLETLDRSLEDVMQQSVNVPVEIDRGLLEVMVSFAWENFSNREAFQGWADNVLRKTISELLEKRSPPQDAVLKLTGFKRSALMSPEFADSRSSSRQLLPTTIQVDQ